MNSTVMKTENLTKFYGRNKVLDNVSFEIQRGKIYGFIGENGAGKTTAIRIMTGLSNATTGNIEILGEQSKLGLEKARNKLGAIVENPIIYSDKTAIDNLLTQGILYGKKDKSEMNKLLKTVGLSDTGKKKAKDFSLGMRQRLGIALALIGKPEMLILDEPTNGLDPMGMIDMRNLLLSLNEKLGITIFVSSHILSELYQLATDYIIISNGRIIEQLTLEEMNIKVKKRLHMTTDDILKVSDIIRKKLNTDNFTVSDNSIDLYDGFEDIKNIATIFHESGVLFTDFTVIGKSLEEYYVEILGGEKNA